jgi:DnaK suppressor protein
MMTDTVSRRDHLRDMLHARRRETQDHVRARIRDGRTARPAPGGDDLDHSGAASQGDLELTLLQMRAETLVRIDAAHRRLDVGQYGFCAECAKAIAERRLRALPFAVRCQACEERREEKHGQARRAAQQRGSPSLFSDVVGS